MLGTIIKLGEGQATRDLESIDETHCCKQLPTVTKVPEVMKGIGELALLESHARVARRAALRLRGILFPL